MKSTEKVFQKRGVSKEPNRQEEETNEGVKRASVFAGVQFFHHYNEIVNFLEPTKILGITEDRSYRRGSPPLTAGPVMLKTEEYIYKML